MELAGRGADRARSLGGSGMASWPAEGSGVDSVGSRTGAGSVGSQTETGSGAVSVGSRTGSKCCEFPDWIRLWSRLCGPPDRSGLCGLQDRIGLWSELCEFPIWSGNGSAMAARFCRAARQEAADRAAMIMLSPFQRMMFGGN